MNTPTNGVNKSKLFIKSVGYAAINLPLDSRILEVLPVEEFGYIDGEITDAQEVIEQRGVDAKGNEYIDVVKTSNTIAAEWMSWGSNRYSPPNVRRGERVLLWQYADDDKYYWTSTGFDDHLRRRETLIMQLSNTVDEETTALTSDNTYSVVFSTHTKELTIQTTMSDGEEFEYIVKIDTKNSHFIVTDNVQNQISIESKHNRVTLHNSLGTSIALDGKDINMVAVGDINLKAKSVNVNAASSYSIKSLNYNIGATHTNIDSIGGFKMSGGVMDLGGSSLRVGNDAVFGGRMMNNGVNVGSTHRHDGVRSGGDNTGNPI